MQHMTKITLPVVLTYDGSAMAVEVQAMVANLLELARIDSRLSTDSQHAVEVGCTSATVQSPQTDLYTLYTGFSEVHDAIQMHLGGAFESLWKSVTDNDRCTLAVHHNRVEFRASPADPLMVIYNKPEAKFNF